MKTDRLFRNRLKILVPEKRVLSVRKLSVCLCLCLFVIKLFDKDQITIVKRWKS